MTDTSGDRVVVVTGGGGGIGRALCVGFSSDGYRVIAVGRTENTLQETCSLSGEGRARYILADLSRPSGCFRAMSEAVSVHGQIDVLVNNAGLGGMGSFLEQPFDRWTATLSVNLVGVAACTYAVLPHMIERRHGRIIMMQSRKARAAVFQASAYCVSKAGVYSFSRCLASELKAAGHGDVLINNLIPGPTRSGMCPAGQPPDRVYPFARELAETSFRRSGETFFRGRRLELDGLRAIIGGRTRRLVAGLLRR